MRKLTLLPLIACCAPLAAQDAATEAAHAAEAIAACQAVVMQDRVDPERLPASGWYEAKRRGSRSELVVRGVYEKEGNSAFIVIGKQQERERSCVVQAFLADTASYSTLLQEVSQEIGMPQRQDGFSYYWVDADKSVRVDPAGDAKRPFARFEVTAIPQESAE